MRKYCLVTITAIVAIAATGSDQSTTPRKPRIFVQGTGNIDIRAEAAGGSHWVVGHATEDAHNQTMELAKTLLQRCPAVKVTTKAKSADYAVGLNHQAFHGVIHKNNQIMVTSKNGDVIASTVARSVGRTVQDACAAIMADWKTAAIDADKISDEANDDQPEAPETQQSKEQPSASPFYNSILDDSGRVKNQRR